MINLYNHIEEHIVRDYLFGKEGKRFTVFILRNQECWDTIHCTRVDFDDQFLKFNSQLYEIPIQDNFDGSANEGSIEFEQKNIEGHAIKMYMELESETACINMETTVTTLESNKDVTESIYKTYIDLKDNFDSNENCVVIVVPSSVNPAFVAVTDNDFQATEDFDSSVISAQLYSIIAGTYTVNADSRNIESDIERRVIKYTPKTKLMSPIYSIKRINPLYKDEKITYNENGEVITYHNTRCDIGFERIYHEDNDCTEEITYCKDTIVDQRYILENDYDKIVINALTLTAAVSTASKPTSTPRFGTIGFDEEGIIRFWPNMAVDAGSDLKELEKKAVEILKSLPKATKNEDRRVFIDGRCIESKYDGTTKIEVTTYHSPNGTSSVDFHEAVVTDKLPFEVKKLMEDDTKYSRVVKTYPDKNGTIWEYDECYNVFGLRYVIHVANIVQCPYLKGYEDGTLTIMNGAALNNVMYNSKHTYVRGAFGVPRKFSANTIVEELL